MASKVQGQGQKFCWSLEIVVLNTGKVSELGPIPILFIPASLDKLVKFDGHKFYRFF